MRNRTQNLLTSMTAIAALVPSIAVAQVRPTTTAARAPGSGQPWQCMPSDSLRAFNRALRADSLAYDNLTRTALLKGHVRGSFAPPLAVQPSAGRRPSAARR